MIIIPQALFTERWEPRYSKEWLSNGAWAIRQSKLMRPTKTASKIRKAYNIPVAAPLHKLSAAQSEALEKWASDAPILEWTFDHCDTHTVTYIRPGRVVRFNRVYVEAFAMCSAAHVTSAYRTALPHHDGLDMGKLYGNEEKSAFRDISGSLLLMALRLSAAQLDAY